jgi:galactokinase
MNTRTFEGSAPGRMDVMGGIADYSGSLVLQMPIRQRTTVKVSLRDDYTCSLRSHSSDGNEMSVTVDVNELKNAGKIDYDFARSFFQANRSLLWTGYVLGCALVLENQKRILFKGGDFEIYSDVPLGKGVSSSAALEVATMRALRASFNLTLPEIELALLAQQVENMIVGAPCGLMDQLTSAFGEEGKLLPIICQPGKILPPLAIPRELKFVGIDSGVRRSVGGSAYADVRSAAFMGYTIIANHLGISREGIEHARTSRSLNQLPYHAYLCNISVVEFEKKFMSILPQTIKGKEFLEKYGGTIDHVTAVEPNKIYKIFDCTAHPVYENDRVRKFMDLIAEAQGSKSVYESLGELMYASHESYTRCGLGSARTDEIVSLAKSFSGKGVFGARITGGGSGGTVCLLVSTSEGVKSAYEIHRSFCKKIEEETIFFE